MRGINVWRAVRAVAACVALIAGAAPVEVASASPPPPSTLTDIRFTIVSTLDPISTVVDPVTSLQIPVNGVGVTWRVSKDGKVGMATATFASWGMLYRCGVCTENILPYYFEKAGAGWYLIQRADGTQGLGGQGEPAQLPGLPSLLNVTGAIAADVNTGTFGPPSVVATATRPALTPGIQHPCISSLEVWVAWAKRHHLAAALAASQRSTNALVTAVTNRLSKYLYPPTSNDMPSFIAAASLTTNRSALDINYCTYMWLAHATSRGPSPDAIPAPAP